MSRILPSSVQRKARTNNEREKEGRVSHERERACRVETKTRRGARALAAAVTCSRKDLLLLSLRSTCLFLCQSLTCLVVTCLCGKRDKRTDRPGRFSSSLSLSLRVKAINGSTTCDVAGHDTCQPWSDASVRAVESVQVRGCCGTGLSFLCSRDRADIYTQTLEVLEGTAQRRQNRTEQASSPQSQTQH